MTLRRVLVSRKGLEQRNILGPPVFGVPGLDVEDVYTATSTEVNVLARDAGMALQYPAR